jgi:hypothetical protein
MPGQIPMNRIPSFLYCAWNLDVIMFIAALLAEFSAATLISEVVEVNVGKDVDVDNFPEFL